MRLLTGRQHTPPRELRRNTSCVQIKAYDYLDRVIIMKKKMTAVSLLCFVLFIYLFACRYFRFRRLKSIAHKYHHVHIDYQKA
jgi:hypothetical protein